MKTSATAAAFGSCAGQLALGGLPVERVAARVGSTPFFAYDRGLLDDRVAQLRQFLPAEVGLSYAIKANPMPAVIQHLARRVDGFDVASGQEMRSALDTTVPPYRISFAGPGKSVGELRQAVAAGVTIVVESPTEAMRIVDHGAELGLRPQVVIRVNPDFTIPGAGVAMSGGPQQFGIDAEEVPALLAKLAHVDIDVRGFHIFAGSQNLRTDMITASQREIVDLVLSLSDSLPQPISYLNLGGGLGIPYFERDEPVNLKAIGDNVADLIEQRIRPNLPDAHTVLELGRYIVGECGVYVTRIVDRKVSRGRTYLVVDGGMHHQLAASGNFGQIIQRNFPIALANRITEPCTDTATVVGRLCTSLDLLGNDVALPAARIGDLVAIFHAGAYGLTASPTGLLSHPAPIEILV